MINDKEKKHDTHLVITASVTEKNIVLIKGTGARQVQINSTLIKCLSLYPRKKRSSRIN